MSIKKLTAELRYFSIVKHLFQNIENKSAKCTLFLTWVDCVAGARVDFESEGKTAIGVYLDAPTKVIATAQAPNEIADDGMDERYKSIYCSSDDNYILGLCGGLAHKFGLPPAAMRVIVFISLFFAVGWIYFVGIFLPKLPTKNVQRIA